MRGRITIAAVLLGALCLLGNVHNFENPVSNPSIALFEMVEVPQPVRTILNRSCADCHTNNTHWPWYSKFPVIGSMIEAHVRKGRAELNLSEWRKHLDQGREEAASRISGICELSMTRTMPPTGYLALHPDARLSAQEIDTLCRWSTALQTKMQ